MVMEYNGDIAQVMAEDDDLDFVVPQGRRASSSRTRCASRRARRIRRTRSNSSTSSSTPRSGAEISTTIKYPTPNAAAVALMPDIYKDNPVIFPPADVMAKCEYAAFEASAREFTRQLDDAMTRLRAA